MNKKIVIVSHSAGGGGAERVSTLVANYFVEKNYDVHFYAIHSDKREYPLSDNIHYVYDKVIGKNKRLKQIKRSWNLRKYIYDNQIDVMISFVYLEGLFLVGSHKVKKIYSLRNDPTSFYNHGINKWLRSLLYRDADYVVFQTPDARNYFDEKTREHGVLIANPLKDDLPYWKPQAHKKEIVVACRINAQKNLSMLLDAFHIVCQTRSDYKLMIYGEGELRESLQKYAQQLGLSDNVIFHGFSNNIHEIMSNSSIYVSSSDYEGISNSMLEALAIGIPTVCTDCPVGGARMFIQSGENGFLVPVGDSMAMAEKLLVLMSDEALQKQFSRESQKIRDILIKEKIYGEWEKLLH